jgi:hypothetical protein
VEDDIKGSAPAVLFVFFGDARNRLFLSIGAVHEKRRYGHSADTTELLPTYVKFNLELTNTLDTTCWMSKYGAMASL